MVNQMKVTGDGEIPESILRKSRKYAILREKGEI